MHEKHTLKVLYNFCIKKKQNMDGASFEAFTYEEENLEHFRKIFRQIKVFLATKWVSCWRNPQCSLAARALIAFEQKKPIITTVKWGKFV